MTYGENSGLLREALGTLLRHHRIQARIGGPGTHTVPVTHTPAERAEIGQQLRRYRLGVLIWCHQAVTATRPALERDTQEYRQPAVDLERRLGEAIEHSVDGLPSLAQLTTRQHFDLVDLWRQAARAAALGEHDFPAGVRVGDLDRQQSLTVLTDAADIVRALVTLDARYRSVPEWQSLHNRAYLGRAASSCTELLDFGGRDFSVDRLGWRPSPRLVAVPTGAGLGGVILAEQNLLTQLNRFPAALNLKRIINSQRALSHRLSGLIRAADPTLSRMWDTRATTYTRLYAEARNVGGLIGDGGPAAAAGSVALDRLRDVTSTTLEPNAARTLNVVFTRIDHRVAEAIAHGVKRGLYLAKSTVPEIDVHDGHVTHRPGAVFLPITSPVQTDLLTVAAELLRPSRPAARPNPGSARSRSDFQSSLSHRPGDPEGPSL